MARETKVGLLAGLAFIICFAMILTKRGNDGGYLRVFPELTSDANNDRPVHSAVIPTGAFRPTDPLEKRSILTGGEAFDQPTGSQRVDVGEYGHQAATENDDANSAGTKGAASRGREHELWRAELEQRLNELANAVYQSEEAPERADGNTAPVTLSVVDTPKPKNNKRTAPSTAQYTVEKGDTLTSIAARFYGTRTRRVIDAIFDANRSHVPSVSQLRIGLKLELPQLDGFDPPRDRTTTGNVSERPARQTSPPQKKAIRTVWYNVQKNDRLSTIARKRLGNANRWREIFELNKQRFPDPHKIRPGVRIKLPAPVLAATGKSQS